MTSRTHITRAVRFALLAGSVAAATPAFAQQSTSGEASLEEIVVTGTRVTSPGVVAISPIVSIGAEEFAQRQPVAVEELIKTLPAAFPAIGPGTNNGSGGGATIDLRGLGAQRSLVLVNGRRVVPFDLNAQVDTNVIPIALIERVDLVTGGASAVYGADAVAGVVNFVLKDDFEGIDASALYGQSGEGDAQRVRADLTMGANVADGRGNFVISLGYTQTDELLQGDRDFGFFSRSSVTGAVQGSQTSIPTFWTNPTPGLPTSALGSVIDPVTGLVRAATDPDTFNFNPVNYFVTPLNRYQVTGLGSYEINAHADVYTELLYTRSDVATQLASSGSFLNVYNVPIGNPYLPNPARQQICAARNADTSTTNDIPAARCVAGSAGTDTVAMALGRRFEEFGPRLNDFETNVFQYTVGVRGDIVGSWSYDAYYSYGESDQIQTRVNWGSFSKVQQALNAFTTTSCVNAANGCVPLNLFGPQGTITPAMVKFVNLDAILRTSVDQTVASGVVNGDLGAIKSPFSENPIGLAFGVEHRRVQGGNKSDSASQIQGEVLGTGAPLPDRSGTITLREAFGEAIIPLVTDMPFVRSLSLEAGYRYTDFEAQLSDNYGSYKYGIDWAPIEDVRLRAMFQRATRAPNINELFAPQVTGLNNLAVDPCQGANINAAQANTPGTLSNLCRLTGVPATAVGTLPAPSAGQVNQLTGGNPELGPEKADTVTLGLVFTPTFINNLTLTIDYWDIEITEAISSPAVTDVLNGCYSTAFNPGLTFGGTCDLVRRSPITGTFNGVDAPGIVRAQSNLGVYQTDGWDLGAAYLLDIGEYGRLSFSFNGTYVNSWKFQANPAAVNRQCVGYYSIACGAPLPEVKFNQRTTWSFSQFDVSYNWYYIGSTEEEPGGTNFLPAYAKIDAVNYIDLSFGWRPNETLRLNLTVANAFDESPPEVGNSIGSTTTNSGNTFPQSYDVVGRYFTLGATFSF
jgi:iron complex outermembrane recepter protein